MNKRGIVVHRGIKYNVRSQDSYNCNYNVYIAGGAGSGKNILIQEMILATFSVEGKVVVFDYGKNFWHLCQVLDGYYIEFNPSNPVLINPNDRMPYMKCPSLANPTAGMATSTNNTNISKKMRFAQQIRVGSALKGGKTYYSVNKTNTYGSWQGAPGGSGESIRNAF